MGPKLLNTILAIVAFEALVLGPISLAAADMAPRGSRKIPKMYKRADTPAAPAAPALPSIAGYTPSTPSATPTAGSPGVAEKKEKTDPSALLQALSGLGKGGGGGGDSGSGASSPGNGSASAGGDPAILNAPPSREYGATDSAEDTSFKPSGPPASGTDFSKASCGKTQSTWITHYGSDPSQYSGPKEARLEGGSKDRHGRQLNSVEESIHNGRPVSLAGDIYGEFGRRCNQSPSKACLMLVCYENFDATYPEYRARFPGVQANCLIGAIVDTGGAFYGTNGQKIDVATRDIKKARKISGSGRYYELETETCNRSSGDKRDCVINNIQAACSPGGAPSGTSAAPGKPAVR